MLLLGHLLESRRQRSEIICRPKALWCWMNSKVINVTATVIHNSLFTSTLLVGKRPS